MRELHITGVAVSFEIDGVSYSESRGVPVHRPYVEDGFPVEVANAGAYADAKASVDTAFTDLFRRLSGLTDKPAVKP